MKLPISQRLLTCCTWIAPGDLVADVGCDHGYLGIHLLRSGTASRVYASDINEAPLKCAMGNAIRYGVADRMRFFLCPGVSRVPRDFDVMVCAGMGADTMLSILDASPWLRDGRYRMVLQCQSKVPTLRRALTEQGFAIRRETLAQDGKFLYPVLEAVFAPGASLTDAQCYLSPALLASGSPLLGAYGARVCHSLRLTAQGLAHKDPQSAEYYRNILSTLEESLASNPPLPESGGCI